MSKYEVQSYTLCDGWINTWALIDEHGETEAETFDTKEQAEEALLEYLADIQDEIDAGQCEPEYTYYIEDFRIAEITDDGRKIHHD